MYTFAEKMSSLDVVFVYAFGETYNQYYARMGLVRDMVQKKLAAQFPGSCISLINANLASSYYWTDKRVVADDGSVKNYIENNSAKVIYENMT